MARMQLPLGRRRSEKWSRKILHLSSTSSQRQLFELIQSDAIALDIVVLRHGNDGNSLLQDYL